jgi:signal transduction histidine kinase
MEVITSSKPIIENIIDEKEELSPLIAKVLKKVDFFNNFSKEVSFLDMISGINYYIKKVDGLPFIIIISLDNKEIQHEILEGAIRKFWEVGTAALIFIILVFAIYKRETSLRARAERATIIANKATKAKSDFLAFTAHEIRSPLGFILTGSEMLTKGYFGKMPEECNNYVGGIHKNAKLILDFITDILDENQIIEGKFKITNAIENVEGIIHQAISINKLRFNDRKINIICQLEPKLPELICDRRRILQVISNLISNAIKYSNDGTTVTVVAKVAHDNMEIEVIDQGIGMSSDDIKVALSIYGMVTRNSHFIDSYGLGLPIVKMLVDIHDGKLSIKSDPNVGTNVKISFPKYKLIYQVKKEDSNG